MVNTPATRLQSMYDPRFEHDACGAGFVCELKRESTRKVVDHALSLLINLTHRGACGCDAESGDGCGILLQIPDAFFRRQIELPPRSRYAIGMLFLPKEEKARAYAEQSIARIAERRGMKLMGWRDVPVRSEVVGPVSRAAEPLIRQVFLEQSPAWNNERFERELFILRRLIEKDVAGCDLSGASDFYIPSLSSRTIVYKGQILPERLTSYYPDLVDPDFTSQFALVHQRFSTNTFPSWKLSQPFRFICHNGEINTLRGNINWMRAREALFDSKHLPDVREVTPLLDELESDSANFDHALELLCNTGRPIPHAVMMMIPEAWQRDPDMPAGKRAFYEYHSALMEPWDGPALVPFTDGKYLGAVLDRNGLRPGRYSVTEDGLVVMASETGAVDLPPETIVKKGRLKPGEMFLIDVDAGRIINDHEIKEKICAAQPYGDWLDDHQLFLRDLPLAKSPSRTAGRTLLERQVMFGYTIEDLRLLLEPMGRNGEEALGSMGDDTPLAVLSERRRPLYDYFKQLFAQVTNPPLDAIREELVTSLMTTLGAGGNLFDERPEQARVLFLDQPVLTAIDVARIRSAGASHLRTAILDATFTAGSGESGMKEALDCLLDDATRAVDEGHSVLILSDRAVDGKKAPIPALLACGAVHHHLIRNGRRMRCSIVSESGEPREVHHLCLLLGFGANAVAPYLAIDTVTELAASGLLDGVTPSDAEYRFIKAAGKGILKVMSKMGISTLQSYCGAQIFEVIGLSDELVDRCFSGTPSRIGGIGLGEVAEDVSWHHDRAVRNYSDTALLRLLPGGKYQWRRNGEHHLFNPLTIATLQQSVRTGDAKTYEEYARLVNDQSRKRGTLRGLLDFVLAKEPVPLDEVEPWTSIVKRFKTGAMSYGSLSKEAHENLAIAMNRIGGRSNTGEGGEDEDRYEPDASGDWRRSAIKQVASGRFGVTINYLVNADELQIKMAQGAKPGEGGQLPAHKVYPWIAKTRHSTPYVGLISPPPHHDIYSIEDLAQLIHDLKNSNPRARISVKLVSEAGVGTIAAGVAKGKADVVLISGNDGGTGASPLTSIKHAGLPWELGLAETHQTLVMNGLRSRIAVECDGQLKTGRDVAIACMLGAEEFGFATAPLVASGCIMMRKCHLNTCPVGIATQDPELRKKFAGKPEHVVNYFHFMAEELRRIMAQLGFRTVDEMIGRTDRLAPVQGTHDRGAFIDFSKILYRHDAPSDAVRCTEQQDHGIDQAIDHKLIEWAQPALEYGLHVERSLQIRNTNRTVGTLLSSEIARRFGSTGLPENTIVVHAEGSAGQSLGAFAAPGLTLRVEGDANDYLGKGLSGGRIVVLPPRAARFRPEKNVLIGNVALYGATSGELFVRGMAGERFAVRNSGAFAVVEGVGDHGCEYMTGGRVVVLGSTGRNFAAGMSGGYAYVLDSEGDFESRCNHAMIELEPIVSARDEAELYRLIEAHLTYTGSSVAARLLSEWDRHIGRFVKVVPVEYRRALEQMEAGSDDIPLALAG